MPEKIMRGGLLCMLLIGSLGVGMDQTSGDSYSSQVVGIIKGRVSFTGKLLPAKDIVITDVRTIQHNDLVVDPKTKGLRYVMAMLENAPIQPKLKQAKPVLVDQRDMIFVPRVVAVQHGQAVRFGNSDD